MVSGTKQEIDRIFTGAMAGPVGRSVIVPLIMDCWLRVGTYGLHAARPRGDSRTGVYTVSAFLLVSPTQLFEITATCLDVQTWILVRICDVASVELLEPNARGTTSKQTITPSFIVFPVSLFIILLYSRGPRFKT